MAGSHLHPHLQQHPQDITHQQQSTISEADFLARVSAFERNEEAEAKRAKEAMRRMIAEQTNSTRHDRANNHGPKRRDRSPSNALAVRNSHEFPHHFHGVYSTNLRALSSPSPPVFSNSRLAIPRHTSDKPTSTQTSGGMVQHLRPPDEYKPGCVRLSFLRTPNWRSPIAPRRAPRCPRPRFGAVPSRSSTLCIPSSSFIRPCTFPR